MHADVLLGSYVHGCYVYIGLRAFKVITSPHTTAENHLYHSFSIIYFMHGSIQNRQL